MFLVHFQDDIEDKGNTDTQYKWVKDAQQRIDHCQQLFRIEQAENHGNGNQDNQQCAAEEFFVNRGLVRSSVSFIKPPAFPFSIVPDFSPFMLILMLSDSTRFVNEGNG